MFDEVGWSLAVGGRRVSVEPKPLELLRELLVHAGSVVSKEELLDRIWPNVTVVEGSLPTAIYKLRVALQDDGRTRRIIETVPGIGYRLLVPVAVEEVASTVMAVGCAGAPAARQARESEAILPADRHPTKNMRTFRLSALVAGAAIALGAATFALNRPAQVPATNARPSFSQREAMNALRRLDVGAIERMLAAGWDPNAPIRAEGNAALHYVIEMCEWDRQHDQERLLLMVRTVYEGGGRLDLRNQWGDTPYSIAKAPRYCGPDHPVTRSLRATCSGSHQQVEDRCEASYELARRAHRTRRQN